LLGRDVTSVISIKDDLINAGGNWVNKELVVSENILTSRSPQDLPALLKKFVSMI
jgi:protease I